MFVGSGVGGAGVVYALVCITFFIWLNFHLAVCCFSNYRMESRAMYLVAVLKSRILLLCSSQVSCCCAQVILDFVRLQLSRHGCLFYFRRTFIGEGYMVSSFGRLRCFTAR